MTKANQEVKSQKRDFLLLRKIGILAIFYSNRCNYCGWSFYTASKPTLCHKCHGKDISFKEEKSDGTA